MKNRETEIVAIVCSQLAANYNRILKADKLFKFCQLDRNRVYRMPQDSEAYANLHTAVTNFVESMVDTSQTPREVYWGAVKDKHHKIVAHVRQVVKTHLEQLIINNTDNRLFVVFPKQSLISGRGNCEYNTSVVVFKAVCKIRLWESSFGNINPTWVSTQDTIGEIVDKTECTVFTDVDGKYYIYNGKNASRVYFEEVIEALTKKEITL